MKDFISPLSDFGFNNLFGTEIGKENLLDLLNSILHDRLGYERIVDLKLNPTENKGLSPERKSTRYDIHCVTDGGHRIIVEMQNQWHHNFDNRIFYYGIEAISRQDRRNPGQPAWDFTIDPVVTIALCNFNQRRLGLGPFTYYTLRDEETNERFGNQLSMVFIHIPGFPDKEEECDTFLKQIIYSLKHMERIQTLEKIPFSTGEGDFFSRIAQRSRYSALNEQEQMEYDRWLKFENDRVLELNEAENKGMKQGLKEGRAEGEKQKAIEVARTAISMGLDDQAIQQLSGLTIEEIQKLK
ncbi:MAG: Rpn family recombination-promoting nuclease/putative transposase [Muribaculaceae bacterium]|nr:Rpn family recombination-promoting nuclease/putative transposase [Muribaculaceae bacterium]